MMYNLMLSLHLVTFLCIVTFAMLQARHTNMEQGWSTVAGVRSTGLTASLGLAARLATRLRPSNSEASAVSPVLPPLATLSADYTSRNDGRVEVAGRAWQLSHPQTKLGLAVTGGLASIPPDPFRHGLGSSAWFQSVRRMCLLRSVR
ncbi:unnamed protein product [Symbiodinium pilosum]|uniref:Uncharacterized protein n=1 Tax=Symbiodinium pilosum TaxID=2952 RepID=A0A812W996_SYMPI|nr:unnamed protein product [Symbiodinium pilosum]